MRKLLGLLILLFIPCLPLAAQAAPDAAGESAAVEVSGGFRKLKLGMNIDQIKELLKADPYFAYRGDPDLSFLPITEEPLITCAGTSFIEKAYFQFYAQKLYIITLVLDPTRMDYYTMYQQLTGKYGKPDSLDPTQVVWEYNEVRLSLERPLSVKYIATAVFDRLKAANQGEEAYLELSRQEFLDQF